MVTREQEVSVLRWMDRILLESQFSEQRGNSEPKKTEKVKIYNRNNKMNSHKQSEI